MRGELVAIDLETTGLDYKTDAIIEVGAVRFAEGRVLAEFSTFVNPGVSIPEHITRLTGIRTYDVTSAPKIEAVLPRIEAFVNGAPIVAHNISMDMSFLQGRHRILKNALRLDTYELAAILMPTAPRYGLASLASAFDISYEQAHRALDDARMTAHLYWALWQKALTQPRALLEEIISLSQDLDWEARSFLAAALRENTNITPVKVSRAFAPARFVAPLNPTEHPQPVDTNAVHNFFAADGQLAQHLETYESRPQQVQMAQAVAEAFSNHKHTMIEAGTGTGKSMAYLVPAVQWSKANQRPVVISTYTINLQEQLMLKDIPAVREALDIPFEAALLKGRSHYLCPHRLETLRRRRPTSLNELRTLAKILVWLTETETADRSEISLRGAGEFAVWNRLSADDEHCTLHRCQAAMEGTCPFYKARKAAESAHIIVANHALLVADAASDGRVLPPYSHLVIDEAHHLEEAITNGMTFFINVDTFSNRLADLGGLQRGLFGELLRHFRRVGSEKDTMRLEMFVQTLEEAVKEMNIHARAFFVSLQTFVRDAHNARGSEYTAFVRISAQNRHRASFDEVGSHWGNLQEYLEVLSQKLAQLHKWLAKFAGDATLMLEDFTFSIETAIRYFNEVSINLQALTKQPDPAMIYWLEMGQAGSDLPSVNIAPLNVGTLADEHLWRKTESVVLTSATLRSGEGVDFLRERLRLEGVDMLDVGSPFDYRNAALLYLAHDIPEPNDRVGYQKAVERGIIELASALEGRVLVLFTSYAHLKQTAQAITPRLALGNIAVYDQSDGSSRQSLLESFTTSQKAVLLGTRSFWEGVDIPGPALSALVITRLPFTVPTDPIFSARSELYTTPFDEYAVPDAVLRFRQGFGRLIRRASDKGIVTVFDSRITNKSYGSVFLESLPECTVHYGPLDGLADAARKWLEH